MGKIEQEQIDQKIKTSQAIHIIARVYMIGVNSLLIAS